MDENTSKVQVIVVGGGQSGLAVGYYLRRTGLSFVILDEQTAPGGAWVHGWKSLRLFSPAEHSSLPGWLLPKSDNEYPSVAQVIDYLSQYEKRYNLPIVRPVQVQQATFNGEMYKLETNQGNWQAEAVVSTTGSWSKPYIPDYPGKNLFTGRQIHSAFYDAPTDFAGEKVLIVGGGNSGAQILAEISKVAQTVWVTEREPTFLPDEVDGRFLFEFASRQYKARLEGKAIEPIGGLGDVVMVDSVKEARVRNVLHSVRPFAAFTESGVIWPEGREQRFDSVVWCTGFRPALDYLNALHIIEADGKVAVKETKALKIPRLWLVGYGSWTGYASATLIGVGRTARSTIEEIVRELHSGNNK
jgi:putative flavoprotein involved in K+ transport